MLDARLDFRDQVLVVDVARSPCTVCPDGDLRFGGENETTCWPPCWRTVALLAAAPFRKPHGVVQMFSAWFQLVLACVPVMFWLNTPGIGAGAPGTVGGCVGPVARETSAAGSPAGAEVDRARVLRDLRDVDRPHGLADALALAEGPVSRRSGVGDRVQGVYAHRLRCRGDDGAGVLCGRARRQQASTRSAATVSVLSSIRASRALA